MFKVNRPGGAAAVRDLHVALQALEQLNRLIGLLKEQEVDSVDVRRVWGEVAGGSPGFLGFHGVLGYPLGVCLG